MRRTLYVLVAFTILLGGCKAKELVDKAKIARDLDKRGTIDLMKQTAEDKYTPPADGKLTDDQIKMYLKVREHEKQIAEVAKQEMKQHADKANKAGGDKSIAGMMEGFKGLGSLADLATADIRAAKDLGFNTQEYLWVKGKVLEASSAAMTDKMTEAINAQMEASYQQMKKAYDEAKDETTKKMYAESLAGVEKSRQEAAAQKQQQDPAVAYNRELVSHYENAMNALASEMAKYSDKPVDTQKTVQDFEKKVDEAKAQSSKQ